MMFYTEYLAMCRQADERIKELVNLVDEKRRLINTQYDELSDEIRMEEEGRIAEIRQQIKGIRDFMEYCTKRIHY